MPNGSPNDGRIYVRPLDGVFDKRGADWRDICADGAGVIGVTLVLWL
ncbi:hypothetical protein KAH55_13245 [bacterium]|nr:hypothetical protein [bacterium]